jgi:hypothetical protein
MVMDSLFLRLGGLLVRLWSEDLSFSELLGLYGPFVHDSTGPVDLDVEVRQAGLSGDRIDSADMAILRSAVDLSLESEGSAGPVSDRAVQSQMAMGQSLLSTPGFVDALWSYHSRAEKWRSFSLSPSGACFLGGEVRQARLFLLPDEQGGIARRLDGYLSILLRLLLAQRQGLLLHAAGVVNGQGAHVFMGPSGSGKTTIARAARERGWAVLADDRLIVRKVADREFRAFGTPWNAMGPPWHGSFGQGPSSAPVDSVFFPQPSTVDRWQRLGSLASSVKMVQTAFPTLKQLEAWGPAGAFHLLMELSENVSCYDLSFSIDCRFLEVTHE